MQPGAYLKVLASLVPKEHRVEHRDPVGQLTDEQWEAMIEELTERIARRAAGSDVKLIGGR